MSSGVAGVKKVLVYGGSGALGSTLVNHFKNKNYWVVSVDIRGNESANENINVNPDDTFKDQESSVIDRLQSMLIDSRLDAVINVAGGWAGGNAQAAEFSKNCDLMWRQSVWSSVISTSIAAKFLSDSGVLTLPGAMVNKPTPGMIGYGMAKAAVHHLTKSLSNKESGLPANSFVAALMPITLDTPMNRKWMPKADTTTWTPLSFIAELMDKWISEEKSRPQSGSLVGLVTTDNKTSLTFE
jgi:dihydropteridine reductase